MKITLNGKPKTLHAPLDINTLLEENGYGDKLVAVARNGEFVARGSYGDTTLEDGDNIEIVAPMQGG